MTDKLILNYTPVAAGQIDSPPPTFQILFGKVVDLCLGKSFAELLTLEVTLKSAEKEAWLPLFLLSLLREIIPEELGCLSGFPC